MSIVWLLLDAGYEAGDKPLIVGAEATTVAEFNDWGAPFIATASTEYAVNAIKRIQP